MLLHTALIKFTIEIKTRLFSSPFHVSTSSGFTLDGAFWSEYVAACSTALRSATDENESGGYVIVPCPSKSETTQQHSGLVKILVTSPE